jgi:hypothetical protein
MTNVAISRRMDELGMGKPPANLAETAEAASSKPGTQTTGSATLEAIAAYIPTEVVGLYIAALAAVRAGEPVRSGVSSGQIAAFWIFLIGTPVTVWMLYSGKVKSGGKKLPISPRKWPLWEMSAAATAFGAWAYALPDSPFARFSWYTTALGTLVVLIVSTLLGLIAPIVQRPLKT